MTGPLATAVTNIDPDSVVEAYTHRHGKPWTISNELISFLGVWESGILNGINFQRNLVTDGLVLTAYLDDRGHPTVGMGHLIHPDDNIKVGQKISKERAEAFARADLADASKVVNGRVKVPLLQFEFDSIVSITFNCGGGAGIDDLAREINKGNYENMFDFIMHYRTGHGRTLAYRRYTEAKMFSSGVYDASH